MTPGSLHITDYDGEPLCGASRLVPTCSLVDWQQGMLYVAGRLVDGATVCARCAHATRHVPNQATIDGAEHVQALVDAARLALEGTVSYDREVLERLAAAVAWAEPYLTDPGYVVACQAGATPVPS